MNADEVLERLTITGWSGPFAPDVQQRATEALEDGKVIMLANLPFRVESGEMRFLNSSVLGGNRKNISFDPGAGTLANVELPEQDRAALAAMMLRFADNTRALVEGLFPHYAAALQRARTSFRPAEIEGRTYSPRHDDRLLHVDAFPTRPMHGRRILRVFTNVAPDGAERHWRVGEPFAGFARAFLSRVPAPAPGSAFALNLLGLTKGKRSAYDHIMLKLHDAGKLDTAYQTNGPKADVRFPAGCTWMCFTDQVLHAALSGHCALEQTFHVPVAAMAHPERAPVRVLEKLAGRALV